MKTRILFLLLAATIFVACSKDEDNSNPVVADPAYVGTYEGTTSQSKEVSFIVSNVDGKAYVTKYSITYTYLFGTSTATATKSQTNTQGIVQVNGNGFAISLSSDANDKITCAFTSATNLTGTFSIDTGLTSSGAKAYGTGTFSITKK